jgi:hypothetical protein
MMRISNFQTTFTTTNLSAHTQLRTNKYNESFRLPPRLPPRLSPIQSHNNPNSEYMAARNAKNSAHHRILLINNPSPTPRQKIRLRK